MLDRVHAGRHADPRAGQVRRVGRHLRAAGMRGRDDRRDLVGAPRGDAGLRPVEIELEQVGAVIELAHRKPQQLVGVLRLDRSVAGHRPGAVQPCAGGADVRDARSAAPPVADAEAQCPHATIDRVSTRGAPTSRAQRTPARSSAGRCARRRRGAARPGRRCGRSSARRRAASGGCGNRPSPARSSSRCIDDLDVSPARSAEGSSPSSSLGRIQAMAPSTTRMLTPTCSRSDRPSASAPSRYRVADTR